MDQRAVRAARRGEERRGGEEMRRDEPSREHGRMDD